MRRSQRYGTIVVDLEQRRVGRQPRSRRGSGRIWAWRSCVAIVDKPTPRVPEPGRRARSKSPTGSIWSTTWSTPSSKRVRGTTARSAPLERIRPTVRQLMPSTRAAIATAAAALRPPAQPLRADSSRALRCRAARVPPHALRTGGSASGERTEQAGNCAPNGARPAHYQHLACCRPLPRARTGVGPHEWRRSVR